MLKRLSALFVTGLIGFSAFAQEQTGTNTYVKAFDHLDLSFSAGVAGLGLEVSAPLSRSFTLRGGVQLMPKFKPEMSFGVGLDGTQNEDGTYEPVPQSKFDEMMDLFTGITGYEVDDKIDMIGEPTICNFSLLVDFAPFKDKRWHFTTGIYAGPSQIGKAYNTTEDMPSLFSINMYNRIYESAYNDEPLFVYGDKAVYIDPEVASKVVQYGRMSINIGDMTDGSGPCRLAPDGESMVKVKMKVNPVRPYLGFGFGDAFKKKDHTDSRYSFSFDAGVLFWGGTPKILTHQLVERYDEENDVVSSELVEVNLAKDVVNIYGKPGDYVRFMKKFKVCPMLNVKITRRLF